MMVRVLAWSSARARLVLLGALLLVVGGEVARRSLQRDVVPDLADPQISVVAEWMGHPASEVASTLTDVLTRSLDGLTGATAVRGSSMAGMAYATVVFGSSSDASAGRQAIAARIESLRATLPAEVRVRTGPDVSSAGWAYQYAVVDRADTEDALSPMALRRLQDTVLRPALQAVPGVAEVASVGGSTPAIAVEGRADRLRAKGVVYDDLVAAVRAALHSWTVAFDPGHPERPPSFVDHEAAPFMSLGEGPVRVADLGRVRVTEDMPAGIADLDGRRPAAGGVVLVQRGADAVAVVERVRKVLEDQRAKLPARARVVTVYDRTELASRVDDTLVHALLEEMAVVAGVLLVFLLHGRSALVPLVTLATTLALTFLAMAVLRLPSNIMSLGGIGIALGLAVDADVVALEACHRRIESLPAGLDSGERRAALVAAASTLVPAVVTSLAITAVAFLPVLAFTGETGRLLRPLALTKTLVIASTAIVAVTLSPALRERLLRGKVRPELDNRLTRGLLRLYEPVVRFALSNPGATLVTAALAVVSCVPLLPRLGGEFLPRLDEGDLLFMPTTLPGIPAEQAASQMRRQELAIHAFPEVESIFGKVGRADTATDPAPASMIETTIRLAPRARWPRVPLARWYSAWAPSGVRGLLAHLWPESRPETAGELVDKLDAATMLPGWTNAWTAPVRARMDMLSTGFRTPVGIRVTAASPERLTELGGQLQRLAMSVPGVRGALFESLGGEPWLRFVPDAAAVAAVGADEEVTRASADRIVAGGQVGDIEGQGLRARVRVMPDYAIVGEADRLRGATVRAGGQPVSLGLLGRVGRVMVPSMVRSEGGARVAYVHVDVTDETDPVGFVERAKDALRVAQAQGTIVLAQGERVDWMGQYTLFVAGRARLYVIVPVVLLAMVGLLYAQFRSLAGAGIVLASVPFALVGSVWTLFLLGYSLSAPVWVGLLSAVGLAMQTGVVMVVYIDEAFHRRVREGTLTSREDIVDAHAEGTIRRLRPKIMTVTTMGAGLLPLLWAEGAGTEILRRVAAPMLGGLLTSAFLTLEVLPVLYTMWRFRQLETAQRTGRALTEVVGAAPPWARG